MTNYKTTIASLIAAIGSGLALIVPTLLASPSPRLQAIGGILVIFGIGGIGINARDKDVSDQQAGIRPEPKK